MLNVRGDHSDPYEHLDGHMYQLDEVVYGLDEEHYKRQGRILVEYWRSKVPPVDCECQMLIDGQLQQTCWHLKGYISTAA